MSRKKLTNENKHPGRALIQLDLEPLLELERERFRIVSEELEGLKERLASHTEADEPAYVVWLHTQFSVRLSEIRKLRARFDELRTLVFEVERYAEENGCTEPEALERITQNSKAPSEPVDRDEVVDDIDPEEVRRSAKARHQAERASAKRSAHNKSSPKKSTQTQASAPDSSFDRVKRAYRALARKLHPDVNANLTSSAKDIWHQAQEAYRTRDAEKLEGMLALVERGGDFSVDEIRSVTDLRALTEDFEKKIRSVEKVIRRTKQSPAWNFRRLRDDTKLFKKLKLDIARELDSTHVETEREVAVLEDLVERWSRPRGRKKN
ncbi:MAG: DnaJ domain-containing protein [Bdellovibrionota bacterium]